jgi:uncharacterized protein
MEVLQRKRWSPYAVGALIGLLSWFAFFSADRPIGVSTAIARTAGMLSSVLAPERVAANPYFAKFPPVVDWEWMLVIGAALGAWISSRLSGDRPVESVEPLWRERFGNSRRKRYLFAFLGGVVLMFGARLAGGCTSGHGISGSLQLALSGWLFLASVFASGILTAFLLFGREKTRG